MRRIRWPESPEYAPWGRHGSGFTLLFEAMVLALAKDMPVLAIARLVGEHDTKIWRVLHHYWSVILVLTYDGCYLAPGVFHLGAEVAS